MDEFSSLQICISILIIYYGCVCNVMICVVIYFNYLSVCLFLSLPCLASPLVHVPLLLHLTQSPTYSSINSFYHGRNCITATS